MPNEDKLYTRDSDGTESKNVKLTGSNIQMPIDIQSRFATTIKTHNAISVAASGNSLSGWLDCDGFDKIGVTALIDAATPNTINVLWSNDGTNTHGSEAICPQASSSLRAGITDIKARYARLQLINGDTAAHTMSAWAYLRV